MEKSAQHLDQYVINEVNEMRKMILTVVLSILTLNAMGGTVGLPRERIALPVVQGNHLVCVWDETADRWLKDFELYDHAGVYEFSLPALGKWYWVGLWDQGKGQYIFGKWVGHFITH